MIMWGHAWKPMKNCAIKNKETKNDAHVIIIII